jgi:transposase InsO family protein
MTKRLRPTSSGRPTSPSEGDRLGLVYLSTILDDVSRYIIAWTLCSTMRAEDVTDTLDLALTASGCDQAHVHHRPRLLSDNVLSAERNGACSQGLSIRQHVLAA